MKTRSIFLAGIIISMSCNNNVSKDSVEKADSANAAKLDSPGVSNEKTAIAVNKNDADFLVKAGEGSMMEVNLGRIASQKSANTRVKDFGEMMIKDHSAAGEKLKDLANTRTVTMPTMTGDEKSKMIRDLNEKKGNDFDNAYIEAMVNDHKEDIKEFETASNNVQDAGIREFIMSTLPVLRKHLDSCTAIQESLHAKHK